MAFKKTFVLSDESVNTYGFWILLSGMDLTAIQANCPLYYEHRTWEVPCGHVENIRLKDDKVLGDIVIEGGNDIELEYIRKIQNGDIKGCSLGIDPVEWSEAAEFLKPGQTRSCLTKCQPYEVSLAPLPGNKNALALRNGTDMITLAADKPLDFIPSLTQKPSMKKIAVLLSMDAEATEDQIIEKLRPIMSQALQATQLQKALEDTLTKDLPEEKKSFFLKLAKTNLESAMEFLNLAKPVEAAAAPEAPVTTTVQKKDTKLVDLIQKGKTEQLTDGKDSFDYLQRHNSVELGRIRTEEPERYAELVKKYQGGERYTAK